MFSITPSLPITFLLFKLERMSVGVSDSSERDNHRRGNSQNYSTTFTTYSCQNFVSITAVSSRCFVRREGVMSCIASIHDSIEHCVDLQKDVAELISGKAQKLPPTLATPSVTPCCHHFDFAILQPHFLLHFHPGFVD